MKNRRGIRVLLRPAAVLAACAGLAACAPATINLGQGELAQIRQQPIRAVRYTPAPFVEFTPGNALLGPIGGAAAVLHGKTLEKKYDLTDPAAAVEREVSAGLSRTDGLVIRPDDSVLTKDSPKDLQAVFHHGLVLDFRTLGWQMIYYPADWVRYRVQYAARARLVRVDDGRVLWQAVCKLLEKNSHHAPTLGELEANNAALLKAHLHKLGEKCSKELLADFATRG